MASRQRAVQVHLKASMEELLGCSSIEQAGEDPWRAAVDRCFLNDQKDKPGELEKEEVLVRLLCRPVSAADVLRIGSSIREASERRPLTPGEEGMGTVEAVGSNVTSVRVGDRVVPILLRSALQGEGSWQEYVKVNEAELLLVPGDISDEVAAQSVVNPWTICGLLDMLQVPKGGYLLQSAAGLALGRQLIQYAHSQGLKTINLIRRRSDRLVAELVALGADEVIPFEDEDTSTRVMEITGGRGAYAAVDPVGGPTMSALLARCVRKQGTVMLYGWLGGPDVTVGSADLLHRGVRLEGFSLARWLEGKHGTVEEKAALGRQVMGLLQAGVMVPPVGKVFNLSEYKVAVEETFKPGQHAKVLLAG